MSEMNLNNIQIPDFDDKEMKEQIIESKSDADGSPKVESKAIGQHLDLRTSQIEDEKHYKRFVNNVKKIIRASQEYKEWTNFIKISMGYSQCFLTEERMGEVTIDLHHHPLSLESIVRIILDTKMINKDKFTSFEIAQEVIEMHYKMKVGFVCLVKTLHEKFHNGYLNLGLDIVQGDYSYLLDQSKYHVDSEIKATIDKYLQIKETPKAWLAYKNKQITNKGE